MPLCAHSPNSATTLGWLTFWHAQLCKCPWNVFTTHLQLFSLKQGPRELVLIVFLQREANVGTKMKTVFENIHHFCNMGEWIPSAVRQLVTKSNINCWVLTAHCFEPCLRTTRGESADRHLQTTHFYRKQPMTNCPFVTLLSSFWYSLLSTSPWANHHQHPHSHPHNQLVHLLSQLLQDVTCVTPHLWICQHTGSR